MDYMQTQRKLFMLYRTENQFFTTFSNFKHGCTCIKKFYWSSPIFFTGPPTFSSVEDRGLTSFAESVYGPSCPLSAKGLINLISLHRLNENCRIFTETRELNGELMPLSSSQVSVIVSGTLLWLNFLNKIHVYNISLYQFEMISCKKKNDTWTAK